MIALVGSAPKYRPSTSRRPASFMRKTSRGDDVTALPGWAADDRFCHARAPHPISILSTVMAS